MLKNPITIVFAFLVFNCTYGQLLTNGDNSSTYSQLGKEGIFIHYNASLLFVGEYFYYSVYCLNESTGRSSDISKIAYVEMVGENGSVIFKHKLRLEDGYGHGDFFIPVSVPSGNYKLIGYTQWMLNWGEEVFFQEDISILNPYTNVQRPFLGDQEAAAIPNNTPSKSSGDAQINTAIINQEDEGIAVSLLKDTLSRREKATIVLQSTQGESSFGRYSISVRRYDSLHHPKKLSSKVFEEKLNETSEGLAFTKGFLPEMRGDLLSGTISTDKPSLPLENQKVLFSMPGEDHRPLVLTTNKKGDFSFPYDFPYTTDTAVFQLLGLERNNYTIVLKRKASPDYGSFSFKKFRLNPKMEEAILERSIHNQIENAYFSVKPDTIGTTKKNVPFYGKDATVYHLDDYTRFSTLKETFVEIINNASVTQDNSGKPGIAIRLKNSALSNVGYQPLVIVDDNILQDFEKLIQYDARKIETIRIKRDLYILGGHIFQGILDVETFDNDFNTFLAPYMKEVKMLRPMADKKYFKQVYTPENELSLKNIPDYRYQLLWLPKIDLETSRKAVELFTSDVPGNYEVSLEGFTFSGKPISIKKSFTVK